MEYMKLFDGEDRFILFEDDPTIKTEMLTKHYHNAFEIYFLQKGSCRYFIDDKSYDVQAGDLILIPAKTIHKTFYGDVPHSRKLIYCSPRCIPGAVADTLPTLIPHYRCPKILDLVTHLFGCIEHEQYRNDRYSSSAMQSYLDILFFALARNRPLNVQAVSSFVTETVSYIKTNYSSLVKLTDVAKILAVSPEHLSRVFKKETGFGFNEYLNMVRLQNADEKLRSDEKQSISDIAYSCGFNDSNYFSDKYKKAYGVPPTFIRKNKS